MRKTLLEIVQDILNDMDGDQVNSINDTVESQQVAQIVRSCYEERIANRNWPHLKKLIQLDHAGELSKPNYLKAPDNLKELEELQYDVGEGKKQYRRITYKEPSEFLMFVNMRDSSNPNVLTVQDYTGAELLIANDKAPTYYTSFDDKHLVFDSYDANEDDTLKKAKTQCIAYIFPEWTHTDDFIPDLPTEAFPMLVEEAKSASFFALKQMINDKAEQKAGRQSRWLARKAWSVKGGIIYPNYGR